MPIHQQNEPPKLTSTLVKLTQGLRRRGVMRADTGTIGQIRAVPLRSVRKKPPS